MKRKAPPSKNKQSKPKPKKKPLVVKKIVKKKNKLPKKETKVIPIIKKRITALPTKFTQGTIQYKQVKRIGDFCIYSKKNPETQSIRFELIKVISQKTYKFREETIKAKELYPQSEYWGTFGFTYQTIKDATVKLNYLIKNNVKFYKDIESPLIYPENCKYTLAELATLNKIAEREAKSRSQYFIELVPSKIKKKEKFYRTIVE